MTDQEMITLDNETCFYNELMKASYLVPSIKALQLSRKYSLNQNEALEIWMAYIDVAQQKRQIKPSHLVLIEKGLPFSDQSFFENFNWHNFEPGDLVWLEDHPGDFIAGSFISLDDNIVTIKILSGEELAKEIPF